VSATGSDTIDFSGSSGDFKTSSGNIYLGSSVSNIYLEGSNLDLRNNNINLYGFTNYLNGLNIGESNNSFNTIQYGKQTNKGNSEGSYTIEFEVPFKNDKILPHIFININSNSLSKDEYNYGYFLKNIDNFSFTYRLYVLKNTNPVEYVIPDTEHEINWMVFI
jgi:hypothetical protein